MAPAFSGFHAKILRTQGIGRGYDFHYIGMCGDNEDAIVDVGNSSNRRVTTAATVNCVFESANILTPLARALYVVGAKTQNGCR